MEQELFSAKLCELDSRIERLQSRIRTCGSSDPAGLEQEIRSLEQECEKSAAALKQNLRSSKARSIALLREPCCRIEQILQAARKNWKDLPS